MSISGNHKIEQQFCQVSEQQHYKYLAHNNAALRFSLVYIKISMLVEKSGV